MAVAVGAARLQRTRALDGPRLGAAAAGAATLLPIVVYAWVVAHRLAYPYELDWMEGGSVELAARAVAGHSLYVAPSLHFVGWTYPPLYYWISAAVAEVTGVGFLPLRLVSTAASAAAMATLAVVVRRESGDRLAGLVAAGLYAATFRVAGSWFDVGRGDSLFVGLTLAALACGRWARRSREGAIVGLLAFLAAFTKQSALIAVVPALALTLTARPRVGIAALATLLPLLAGSTLLLDALSHGWYRYYVFDELAGQPWASSQWVGFWRGDILAPEWPVVLLAAAAVVLRFRLPHGLRSALRSPSAYQAAAVAGLLAAAWVSRLHTGGYRNVLMPAYAATALVGGLAFAALRRRGAADAVLVSAMLALQVALLWYPVDEQLPSRADRLAGAELIAYLRTLPAPVLVLRHPWYATELGKGTFAQGEAITDLLRSAAPRGARVLRRSLAAALNRDRVQAVVLDGSFDAGLLGPELTSGFRRVPGTITRRELTPLTDVRTAPTLVYLRVHRLRLPRP